MHCLYVLTEGVTEAQCHSLRMMLTRALIWMGMPVKAQKQGGAYIKLASSNFRCSCKYAVLNDTQRHLILVELACLNQHATG